MFGGFRIRPDKSATTAVEPQLFGFEAVMRNSLRRVSSGWDVPVTGGLVRSPNGSAMVALWMRHDRRLAISVVQEAGNVVSVRLPAAGVVSPPAVLEGWTMQRWPGEPNEDQLTMAMRMAMESADSRNG